MTTRRAFLSLAAGIAGINLAHGSDKPSYKYIDIHTHIGTFHFGKPLSPDDLVKMMDQHAIEKA